MLVAIEIRSQRNDAGHAWRALRLLLRQPCLLA
jgi:hypothetical protein